jgi:hypothetical protein
MAVLELLTGAAWALVVAAEHGRLVDWLSQSLLRGAAGEEIFFQTKA